MQEDLNCIIDWLVKASKEIPKEYFQLPVVGKECPIYRERVYCYELYHQLRTLWLPEFGYSLCGEIDKKGHPIIREPSVMPDFLIHVPGNQKMNLLIVEIKPTNADINKMIMDFKKIIRFMTQLKDNTDNMNYYAGIFWLYGNSKKWENIRKKIENGINDKTNLKRIQVFTHEKSESGAIQVGWSFQDNNNCL